MTNYLIFSRSEYFSELISRINAAKPGERVALATMNLEPWDPAVNSILESLNKAAARGASVSLIIDAYVFMAGGNMFKPGPLFWRTNLPQRLSKNHKLKLKALEDLKLAGGRYVITNQPKRRLIPPFKGRSHIKFAVINNYVFVGNCNLDKENQIDLMIGWEDPNTADRLYDFAEKIIKTESILKALGSSKDREFAISANSRLFIDTGQPNQSMIFNQALKLINSAQKFIVFACQYFPDKKVLDHLEAAHNRGVEVKLIYNHPLNRSPALAAAHYLNKTKSRLLRPGYLFENELPRKSAYLHAKLLASEKSVMIGSHNFIEAGVKFGTAELALYINDPVFSKDCVKALTDQL